MAQHGYFEAMHEYLFMDKTSAMTRLQVSISAIWQQGTSRANACNIMHRYITLRPHAVLHPNMPSHVVFGVVIDAMMLRSREWNRAQLRSEAVKALCKMHELSQELDRQRNSDNASAEDKAMHAIMAARLASEASAALAAQRAGMAWSGWPAEEPWDAGYY